MRIDKTFDSLEYSAEMMAYKTLAVLFKEKEFRNIIMAIEKAQKEGSFATKFKTKSILPSTYIEGLRIMGYSINGPNYESFTKEHIIIISWNQTLNY